jgi:predicted NACHT family NTPase
LDPDTVWELKLLDHVNGEGENGKRINQLREQLERDNACSFFKNPDELSAQAMAAVQLAAKDDFVDESAIQLYLQQVQRQFIDHMRQRVGKASDDELIQRYLPLRLQNAEEVQADTSDEKVIRFASWQELIETKQAVLVLGSAGSGKTTLLLHIAYSLAKQAESSNKT